MVGVEVGSKRVNGIKQRTMNIAPHSVSFQ